MARSTGSGILTGPGTKTWFLPGAGKSSAIFELTVLRSTNSLSTQDCVFRNQQQRRPHSQSRVADKALWGTTRERSGEKGAEWIKEERRGPEFLRPQTEQDGKNPLCHSWAGPFLYSAGQFGAHLQMTPYSKCMDGILITELIESMINSLTGE